MNLYLRLLILLIKSRWKQRLAMTDKSILRFIVLPSDLDINMHMNNGRFNSIMDLGRIDIMVRTGVFKIIRDNKWSGQVGSIHTQFRRPLKLFQAYELHSQVVYWDEKWTWLEHNIYSQKKLISRSLVQTLVRGKGVNITTSKLQTMFGSDTQSPDILPDILTLQSFGPLE